MKKRILALLLTGLLVMSAAACQKTTENPNLNGTTNHTTTTTGPDNPPPPQTGYTTVDEDVYAVADIALRTSASTTEQPALTVPFKTALHRVKYSSSWSVVEYNNTEYYVLTSLLTTDDLEAKKIVPFNNAVIMHVSDEKGANVRKYPSTNSLIANNLIKTLSVGTNVTVYGKGNGWCQVKLDNDSNLYYISADLLTEGKQVTQAEIEAEMNQKFSFSSENPTTMYVTNILPADEGDKLNYRTHAIAATYSTIKGYFVLGDAVKVTSIATINGSEWAQIVVEGKEDFFYVNTYYLTDSQQGASDLNADLDKLLDAYPAFKKYDAPKTMYASTKAEGGIPIRYSPVNDVEFGNVLENAFHYTKDGALTVVAYGTGDKVSWCIVNYRGGYYFANTTYMTPHEDGTPIATLGDLLAKYTGLTACNPVEEMTVKKTIKSYEDGERTKEAGTYAVNDKVSVVAKGIVNGSRVYLVETSSGSYVFILGDAANVA